MSDVLVLNASYEPLTKISWERAITLVVAGKAVVEEEIEGSFIRSKTLQLAMPKIVRLLKYVKVPYSYGPVPFTKAGVLKRDKYLCIFCGKKADTVEHLLPQSRWPELARDWENTAAACFKCNNKKGDRTVEEANLSLRFKPTTPYQLRRLRGLSH